MQPANPGMDLIAHGDRQPTSDFAQKYLKKQQAKWSAFESTTERIPWDHPEFPVEERGILRFLGVLHEN